MFLNLRGLNVFFEIANCFCNFWVDSNHIQSCPGLMKRFHEKEYFSYILFQTDPHQNSIKYEFIHSLLQLLNRLNYLLYTYPCISKKGSKNEMVYPLCNKIHAILNIKYGLVLGTKYKIKIQDIYLNFWIFWDCFSLVVYYFKSC